MSSLNKKIYNVKTKNFIQKLSFYGTYESAPLNALFLIKGSYDTLEISIKSSNASEKLRLEAGDKIEIS